MTISMLEYLAALRKNGHQPQRIGEVVIGITHYAAGEFIDATARRQTRIALMPMYRSDWVTRDSTGPTPKLLPASYVRNSKTVYRDGDAIWYISGWHDGEGVLWMDSQTPEHVRQWGETVKPMKVHWNESFETAMALAGPEVRKRIAFRA